MGFFDFLSSAGKKLLGSDDDNKAIQAEIENSFDELPVDGLVVEVDGDTVALAGVAKDLPTKEKAILIAGNVEGIAKVNADQLFTPEEIADANVRDAFDPMFYTIKKGDTLWAISETFYNDGSKYTVIVEENIEVIKDADLIYPDQVIRIPNIA